MPVCRGTFVFLRAKSRMGVTFLRRSAPVVLPMAYGLTFIETNVFSFIGIGTSLVRSKEKLTKKVIFYIFLVS